MRCAWKKPNAMPKPSGGNNGGTTLLPPGSLEVRVKDVFTALPQLAANGSKFDLVLANLLYGDKKCGVIARVPSRNGRRMTRISLSFKSRRGVGAGPHQTRARRNIPARWQEELKILKHGAHSIMQI